jgi:hypothetical protein
MFGDGPVYFSLLQKKFEKITPECLLIGLSTLNVLFLAQETLPKGGRKGGFRPLTGTVPARAIYVEMSESWVSTKRP